MLVKIFLDRKYASTELQEDPGDRGDTIDAFITSHQKMSFFFIWEVLATNQNAAVRCDVEINNLGRDW